MKQVKQLYDQGLINKDDYDKKVKEIMDSLSVNILKHVQPIPAMKKYIVTSLLSFVTAFQTAVAANGQLLPR